MFVKFMIKKFGKLFKFVKLLFPANNCQELKIIKNLQNNLESIQKLCRKVLELKNAKDKQCP